jgi:hypothetical protein
MAHAAGATRQPGAPGTSTVNVPSPLFHATVAPDGKLTGPDATVTVSHSDPGLVCTNITEVD